MSNEQSFSGVMFDTHCDRIQAAVRVELADLFTTAFQAIKDDGVWWRAGESCSFVWTTRSVEGSAFFGEELPLDLRFSPQDFSAAMDIEIRSIHGMKGTAHPGDIRDTMEVIQAWKEVIAKAEATLLALTPVPVGV